MPLNETLLKTLHFDGWGGGRELVDECTKGTPPISGFDKLNNRPVPVEVDDTDTDLIKTLVRTRLPETDPFRYANEGVEISRGVYEKRLVELATATSYWQCDKSLVDKNPERGEMLMRKEAEGIIKADMIAMEKQFFYGDLVFFSEGVSRLGEFL